MKLFRNRAYKSGSRWAFWRWTDVDSEYITRLHVLKTPWFAVCLHWINKPDPEPFLHDHPVSFLSIILRGGYVEQRSLRTAPWLSRRCARRWFNVIRAAPEDRHSIVSVRPGTVTLCFMGPKVRDWGFRITGDGVDQRGARHTAAWVMWKDYYRAQRAAIACEKDGIQ